MKRTVVFIGVIFIISSVCCIQAYAEKKVPDCEGRTVCPGMFLYNRWMHGEEPLYGQFRWAVLTQTYQLNQLHKIPDTLSLHYYNFYVRPAYNTQHHGWEIIDQHENWFLHEEPCEKPDIKDCRIKDTRWPIGSWRMDVSNEEYVAFMKTRYRDIKDQWPLLDGYFIDGPTAYGQFSLWTLKHLTCYDEGEVPKDRLCPDVFKTEDLYNAFYGDALHDLTNYFPDITFVVNSSFPPWPVGPVDGEMGENFFHFKDRGDGQNGDPWGFKSEKSWRHDLDRFAGEYNAGRISMILTGARDADDEWTPPVGWHERMAEYTTAAFLLGKHTESFPLLSFDYGGGDTDQPIYETNVYDVDIGEPDGDYVAADCWDPEANNPNCIYTRDYSDGLVVVNPTNFTRFVALNGSFEDLDGNAVADAVILAAHTGKILKDAPGGPVIRTAEYIDSHLVKEPALIPDDDDPSTDVTQFRKPKKPKGNTGPVEKKGLKRKGRNIK
ncbi:putative glycoside hydrolase [Candidatus Omnitrophota bacterium]